MPDMPETAEINVGASTVINHCVDERVEKDWIKLLFPSAILFECKRVLIPMYEVRLRHGNKVSILLIEVVNGSVLSDY